jgi:hypothetical protein
MGKAEVEFNFALSLAYADDCARIVTADVQRRIVE